MNFINPGGGARLLDPDLPKRIGNAGKICSPTAELFLNLVITAPPLSHWRLVTRLSHELMKPSMSGATNILFEPLVGTRLFNAFWQPNGLVHAYPRYRPFGP